jgi:hypothetical protein
MLRLNGGRAMFVDELLDENERVLTPNEKEINHPAT